MSIWNQLDTLKMKLDTNATKPKNKLAQAGWRMIKNKATDSKSKNILDMKKG